MIFRVSRPIDHQLAPNPEYSSLDDRESEKAVPNELISKNRMSNIKKIHNVTQESLSLLAIIKDVETHALSPKSLIPSSNKRPSPELLNNAKGKRSTNEATANDEPVRQFPESNSQILMTGQLNNKRETGSATKSHIKLKSLTSSVIQLLSLTRLHEEHFFEEDQTKQRLNTDVRTVAHILPRIPAQESSCKVNKPTGTESSSSVLNTVTFGTQIEEAMQVQTAVPLKSPRHVLAQNPIYGSNFLNSSSTLLSNTSKELFHEEIENVQNSLDSKRSVFPIPTKKWDPHRKFHDKRNFDSVLNMSELNATSRPVMTFFKNKGTFINKSSIRNFADEHFNEEESRLVNDATWKKQNQIRQLKFLSNSKDLSSTVSDAASVTQLSLESQVHVPQKRTSNSSTSSTNSISIATALFSSLVLVKLGGKKKSKETEKESLSPFSNASMTPSMINLRPNADILEAPFIKNTTDAVPSSSFFSGAIASLSNMVFDIEAEHILKLEHVEKLLRRGNEHDDAGRHKKALSYYNKVLSYQRDIHGKDHLETAKCLNSIGVSQTKQGNFMLALTAFEEALHIRQEILGRKHDDVLETTLNINRVVAEANKGTYSAQLILDQINDASARQPRSSTSVLSNQEVDC